jgi:uncharacterized membrane protein YgaE (UPF0421/DUF939 family)
MTRSLPARPRAAARSLRRRLRPSTLPILQTAAAAVAAWYVAVLLLPSQSPTFASIAAVICLGATYGQRPQRAVELIGGVLLGIVVADLLLLVIDRGPLQLGLLVILAMSAAVLLRGGGELFVNEAAISAIILVSLEPAGGGFSLDRILEGLIGGGVALAVSSLLFPPHPVALVGGNAQALFGKLARTLAETADALAAADFARAERALAAARELDGDVAALHDAMDVARDTARFAPPRRHQRAVLRRYEATLPQIDFAVRNTRVLARHSLRYTRNRLPAPDGLAEALHELVGAVWALGAQYEAPERATELRRIALGAATRAADIFEREPDLAVTEIVGQVRSIAVDLMRAADVLADPEPDPLVAAQRLAARPTEELLVPLAP